LIERTWKRQIALLVVVTIATTIYLEFLSPLLKTPATVVSILGISLSFFIAFLNSHAYERWTQGRIAFGGVRRISRDFARMVLAFISARGNGDKDLEVRALQRRLVHRQLAVACALKARLRKGGLEGYRRYLDENVRSPQRHAFRSLLPDRRRDRGVGVPDRVPHGDRRCCGLLGDPVHLSARDDIERARAQRVLLDGPLRPAAECGRARSDYAWHGDRSVAAAR